MDFAYLTAEDLILAATGNTVFAKRVDHFVRAEGEKLLTIRANGVFVVEGLRDWRDYFDTAAVATRVAELNS